MTACTTCGAMLAAAPPPPGMLTPVWGHAAPVADGHEPGVPPLIVTYRDSSGAWDAECAEVPGFPVRGAQSLDEARQVARTLLLTVMPPRPVKERTGHA